MLVESDFNKVKTKWGLLLGLGILLAALIALAFLQQSQGEKAPVAAGPVRLVFTTNWFAQAEQGGFFQAAEEGLYKEAGLDVEIRQGNAQVNGPTLLMSGGTDFFMGSGFEAVKALSQDIPIVTVAALFQKDPQVLIAHPNVGNDSLESLKGKPIMVSATANTSFWPFLVAKFGFTDEQKRPYTFNVAPFLADPQAIQQGYGTSEPFTIEKQLGKKPNVFYLADHGYLPYATTIETRREMIERQPDVVRKFVAASIEGWKRYLRDPTAGFRAIQRVNPEMKDELLNYGFTQMKAMGLVDSGDAQLKGVGAMTAERWQAFYQSLVDSKLFPASLPIEKAYSLDFLPLSEKQP
ncbi:MAG: hypothetical protein RIR26_554 [Pseudomonadota bacterium]